MEKMTKEKLKSVIENAIKEREIDLENTDREDIMKILRNIESTDDTLLFDLIADAECHPISIQVFTTVKTRFDEHVYDIILTFDLQDRLYGNIDQRTEAILNEFNKAYNLQETFNS